MMRTPPDSLEALLLADEGESLTAYPDSRGLLTIGRGICVDPRVPGAGLTPQESKWIALNRQAKATHLCEGAFSWFARLSAPRQAVIVSMCYQLGLDGLHKFTHTLEAVGKGDWSTAAKEMRDSEWADQTPNRANRLAQQMETGQWV